MGVAVEAVLRGVVPGLDLDQADVEPGRPVAGEFQGAGDMDRADRDAAVPIVDHGVARPYLDP